MARVGPDVLDEAGVDIAPAIGQRGCGPSVHGDHNITGPPSRRSSDSCDHCVGTDHLAGFNACQGNADEDVSAGAHALTSNGETCAKVTRGRIDS